MTVTRREEFETAHILPGYNGPCGNLHGHSYKIEVTVEGPQDTNHFGMVVDFKDLKTAIKAVVPDHKFVFNSANPSPVERDIVEVLKSYHLAYEEYPFCTTAENMTPYFAQKIEEYLKNKMGYNQISVVEVNLWETTNSHATWRKTRDSGC